MVENPLKLARSMNWTDILNAIGLMKMIETGAKFSIHHLKFKVFRSQSCSLKTYICNEIMIMKRRHFNWHLFFLFVIPLDIYNLHWALISNDSHLEFNSIHFNRTVKRKWKFLFGAMAAPKTFLASKAYTYSINRKNPLPYLLFAILETIFPRFSSRATLSFHLLQIGQNVTCIYYSVVRI